MYFFKLAIVALLILVNLTFSYAQEWGNKRLYQKETGNTFMQSGCWLKKDRKRKTETWKNANTYNLSIKNGNEKYKSISQIRDFYVWFDETRKKKGHDIKWIGIASIVADQLSKLESGFISVVIVRDKGVVKFGKESSEKVFDFAFLEMNKVYFSDTLLKGKDAEIWDIKFGKKEQCEVLEPIYQSMSRKSLHKLERIAKGKGIFFLGINKSLRYEGSINDCSLRFEHGMKKLIPFYSLRFES